MEEHVFACSWNTRTTLSPREIPASHRLELNLYWCVSSRLVGWWKGLLHNAVPCVASHQQGRRALRTIVRFACIFLCSDRRSVRVNAHPEAGVVVQRRPANCAGLPSLANDDSFSTQHKPGGLKDRRCLHRPSKLFVTIVLADLSVASGRQITWSHHDAKAESLFPKQTSHFVSTRVAHRPQAEPPKKREMTIDLTTLVPTTQSAGFNVRLQHIVE